MRLIALAAAGLFLAANPAIAAGTSSIVLDNGCQLTFRTSHQLGYTAAKISSCQFPYGAGFVGKLKGQGAAFVSLQGPDETKQYVMIVSYPFVSGGGWGLYYTANGDRVFLQDAGQYTVVGTAQTH